jgi:hypothetical protein
MAALEWHAVPMVAIRIVIAVLVCAASLLPPAPDLSGTWQLDPQRSTAIGGGQGARDGGGGGGGGLGLGASAEALTIRQTSTSVIIDERRGTTTARLTFRLDGTRTSNTLPAGRNSGASAVCVTTWKDAHLVTTILVTDSAGTGQSIEYHDVRYLDGDGSLVVETTVTGSPNARRSVYRRVRGAE